MTRKMPNKILAIPAAPAATPLNPNAPAMIEITNAISAHLNKSIPASNCLYRWTIPANHSPIQFGEIGDRRWAKTNNPSIRQTAGKTLRSGTSQGSSYIIDKKSFKFNSSEWIFHSSTEKMRRFIPANPNALGFQPQNSQEVYNRLTFSSYVSCW
jgi:hypothetical protein